MQINFIHLPMIDGEIVVDRLSSPVLGWAQAHLARPVCMPVGDPEEKYSQKKALTIFLITS